MIEPTDSGSPPPPARRRWIAPAAAVAALAVGVGGTLAAVRPWEDDPATTSEASAPAGDEDGATPELAETETTRPALPERRFVLDPPPDGYEVTWLNDPGELTADELGMGGTTGTTVLLVGNGATLADGPWLTVNARPLDQFEQPGWSPTMNMPTETSRELPVGEYRGAVGESWDGTPVLTFGPVDDEYVVSLNTRGITEQQLIAVAGSVVVEGGRAKLAADALPAPMEVLATQDGMYDASPMSMFNQYGSSISVSYTEGGFTAMNTAATGTITLQHQIASGDDPLRVARFLFGDPVDTEVGALPAVSGTLDAFGGFGSRAVTWVDQGDAITLFSTNTDDLDLMTAAAAVVEASADTWDELLDEAEARQREMEEAFSNPPDAWFIGAGDLDDSTTWLVEGSFSETGAFNASVSEFTGNGSSFGGGGGMPNGPATEIPSVQVQSSGGAATVIVALGPVEPAGAVLRVTLDDGTVTEVPLRTIRPDWPASAAAWGVDSNREGTAELVAPDGSVLASAALSGGGAPGGPQDTAVAVTETVAAASG